MAVTRNATLFVLLGASAYPKAPDLNSSAFASTADAVKKYLLNQEGFGLVQENLLDLFDSDKFVEQQYESLESFIDCRSEESITTGEPIQNLVLYYIGHGGFEGPRHDYFLATKSTRRGGEGPSSFRIADLAEKIRKHCAQMRKFLILDCCFAASAFKGFQAPLSAVVAEKVLDGLTNAEPGRGTTLLCASSAHEPALTRAGAKFTVFSEALLDTLRTGDPTLPDSLSLADVANRVEHYIRAHHPEDGPRPEIHSPDQRGGGSIASIPLFPNPARKLASALCRDLPAKRYKTFFGRAEHIDRLQKWLRDRSSPMFGIFGLGGIGKSALAYQFAEIALREKLVQGAVWVQAERSWTFNSGEDRAMEVVLQRLGAAWNFDRILTARTWLERWHAARSLLSAHPTLVVLDNLEVLTEALGLASRIQDLVQGTQSCVLVTSRVVVTEVPQSHLRGLEEPEGLGLMRDVAERLGIVLPSDNEQRRAVVGVGGSPLAIKLLVGQLRFRTAGDILKTLADEQIGLEARDGSEISQRLFAFLFESSWRQLDERGRQLFVALAHFPENLGGLDTMIRKVIEPDGIGFERNIGILCHACLVEAQRVGESGSFRYWLHPLVHEFVRKRLEDSTAEAQSLRARFEGEFKRRYIGAFIEYAKGAASVADAPGEAEVVGLLEAMRKSAEIGRTEDDDGHLHEIIVNDASELLIRTSRHWADWLRHSDTALERAQLLEQWDMVGWNAFARARVFYRQKRLDDMGDAIRIGREAARRAAHGRMDDKVSLFVASLDYMESALARERRNYGEAIRLARESVSRLRDPVNSAVRAIALYNLASAERSAGNGLESLAHFEQARTLFEAGNKCDRVLRCERQEAGLWVELAELRGSNPGEETERALSCLHSIAEAFEGLHQHRDAVLTLEEMAKLQRKACRHRDALDTARNALTLALSKDLQKEVERLRAMIDEFGSGAQV
jgi:tetratricopeptide (TPR) repeat protein